MILLKQTSYIINQNFKKVYKFNEDFPPIFHLFSQKMLLISKTLFINKLNNLDKDNETILA